MDALHELFDWTRSLEVGIAFLLSLPFFVALAGAIASWRERAAADRSRRRQRSRHVVARHALPDSRSRASGATGRGPRP